MTPPNPIDRLPWFLVLCALLAGCGTDDDCPTCPPVGGGLIEGFVTDGGRTIDDLSVTFESIDDTTYTFEATAPVDSTGRYRINAPPCRGLLRLERRGSRLCYHARDTLTFRNTLAETLRVGHERIQADFRLGRGWIELMLPEEMTDDDIDLELGGMGMYPDVEAPGGVQIAGKRIFQFRYLLPGRYEMEADLRDRGYDIGLDELHGVDPDLELSIAAGEESIRTIAWPDPVRISGTVTGSWREMPFSAPSLKIRPENAGSYYIDADENGDFSYLDFIRRPFRILVRIGYQSCWIGGIDEASAILFDPTDGNDIAGIEHVESGIRCAALIGPDVVLEHFDFDLFTENGEFYRSGSASNDHPDTLMIPNLHPGTYYLQCLPGYRYDTWMPVFHADRPTLEAATPIVVEPGGRITDIVQTLTDGARITGRLTREGEHLSNSWSMSFMIWDIDAGVEEIQYADGWTYDDETGLYSVHRLPPGRYRIALVHWNQPRTWFPGLADSTASPVFELSEGEILTDADWSLER